MTLIHRRLRGVYLDRTETSPPGWRVSTADDGIRFVDTAETVSLEATPTRSAGDGWRLACNARSGDVEFIDELGTVPSKEDALEALRSATWLVHRNGIDAEHVGISLEHDGRDVTWSGWRFE